ncbi:MAG: peptidoglycan editing factor PgeF [Chloracidobacterium sp.]|nr:peptidoglycan editing factor PgeF [Chloracidobacterium sp.]
METIMDNASFDDEQTLADSPLYWRERDGVKVLVCKPLEDAGFANGFSTRVGGVSPFPENDLNLAGFNEDAAENIFENRRRFLNVFDGDFRLATVWQIHGDTVKILESYEDIGESDDHADAVLSDLDGILAGAKTADCVPVLIGDPATGAYAAIHAGWRGTVASIVQKTVSKMTELYGSDPANLIAAIGPAASFCNYEIGEDVMSAFAENFAGSVKYFTPTRDGHARVNLHLANRDQLIAVGLSDANIHAAPYCTMERPDLFFSYRLEKQKLGKTGRLLSVIGRRS